VGVIVYTPNANQTGADSFSVKVTDNGTGTLSDEKTVNVTITAVNNDTPTDITGALASVAEGLKPAGTLVATDPDATNTHTWALAATGTTCSAVNGADNLDFTLTAAGVLSFTAFPNFETPADEDTNNVYLICAQVTDAAATPTTFQKALTVTVTNVNEMPSFTKGSDVTVAEDSAAYSAAFATAILNGDAPAVQALTFNVTVPTAQQPLFSVQPAISSAGLLTFTPAANANGVATVAVTLTDDATINGPALTTAAQTFTITITAVNDAPVFTAGGTITIPCDFTTFSTPTAWATGIADIDLPAQTLTFSANLTTPVVTGITSVAVNSTTGIATINLPAVCVPGTKTVPITLTDNGTPPASVSHDMTIVIVPVYSISGTITPPAGFGLLAGGTQVKFDTAGIDYTATALLTGAYSITGIPSGTVGTLVPSHASGSGYAFVADGGNTAAPITLTASLLSEDFTATGTRSISGTITEKSGARLPAGTVVTFGPGLVFTAPVNGGGATTAFSITGIPPKNYILNPVLSGGATSAINGGLSPATVAASTGFGNDTVGNSFTFAWKTYKISGTIKTPSGAAPVGKAFTVKVVGTVPFVGVDILGSYTAKTGYTVSAPVFAKPLANNDPVAFTGNLDITGVGYQTFTPLVAYLGVADVDNPVTAYGDRSVFGDPAGAALDGVTIDFGGGLSSPVEGGYFSVPYLERKSYTLTPTAAGYFFTTSATSFTQVKLTANVTKADVDLTNKFFVFVVPVNALPANGSVEAGANVTFTWSAVPGITNYKVEYATSASFSGKVTSLALGNVTTYTPTTPFVDNTVDKTYYWRVVPYNAAGTAIAGPASAATTFKR
jgi:hypothetical protein